MTAIDFRRAADLFVSSDAELAAALRLAAADIARYRRNPASAPKELLTHLADVLMERGRAMVRVGEMLREAQLD